MLITLVVVYVTILVLGYLFQVRLIFYPGRLPRDYRFDLSGGGREIFLETKDGETINALYYLGTEPEVVLYFHGNAGDLSGWQHIAGDFTQHGYAFFIIDYRGYGKSTGRITEKGLYADADAAYDYLAVRTPGYNHTPSSYRVPLPNESILLHGSGDAVGASKYLAVKAGDVVQAEAWALYPAGTGGNHSLLNNLVDVVTGSFGIVNSGETQTAYQAFSSDLPGYSSAITQSGSVPKAYLGYILFSSDYSTSQFGYHAVSVEANGAHEWLEAG